MVVGGFESPNRLHLDKEKYTKRRQSYSTQNLHGLIIKMYLLVFMAVTLICIHSEIALIADSIQFNCFNS